ncbi:Acetone carboxylase beta subunit [subsurface metagenome]
MKEGGRVLKSVAIDTGGTTTDAIAMDTNGEFAVGKAASTPQDESKGILNAIRDACERWGLDFNQAMKDVDILVYSGTAMLNRLLQREGNKNIGIITTAGFEDLHGLGRAMQNWIGLPLAGCLHAREHKFPEPLVPREKIRGVRERVSFIGEELIPLYEDDVTVAVEKLLDLDVNVICVCLLSSYRDPTHERRVKEIAEDIIKGRGKDVRVVISYDVSPIRGETPRLNTMLVEQYAAEPSREQLRRIQQTFREGGTKAALRVLTCYGGTVSVEHERLVTTLMSGPIGGAVGGAYLGNKLGLRNIIGVDVGGTSFDVALISERYVPTRWETSLAGFLLNIPMIGLRSMAAGGGTYIRYNKVTGRLECGPDSAGADIGVCNKQANVQTVTRTDCAVALGYLAPDRYLGGAIPLDRDRAIKAIEEQLAEPVGKEPYETARGMLDLVELEQASFIEGMVEGLGYKPENYVLLCYGGGGPLFLGGSLREMKFQDILIPSWAANFSAFGCLCGDYAYRYEKEADLVLPPDGSLNALVAGLSSAGWKELKDRIVGEFERDGRNPEEVEFRPSTRLMYKGMLDDLEVDSPSDTLEAGDMKEITSRYDKRFEEIFKRGTKSPELGYTITKLIQTGLFPIAKPEIPRVELVGEKPEPEASRGSRDIYWEGKWHKASLWEWNLLKPGNKVKGPAVIESPTTTLPLFPNWEVYLDEYRIFHLKIA